MISLQDMARNAVRATNHFQPGDKIAMIKMVRALSGCGLRESKEAVDIALEELAAITAWTDNELDSLKHAAGLLDDGREIEAVETMNRVNADRAARIAARNMWPFTVCE